MFEGIQGMNFSSMVRIMVEIGTVLTAVEVVSVVAWTVGAFR